MISIDRGKSVFIGGATRSGTTLMLALLDSHPDLLVFPEECNYFNFSEDEARTNGVVRCLYRETSDKKAKILERMRGNASNPRYAEEIDYSDFDFEEYSKLADEIFQEENESSVDSELRVRALLSMLSAYNICEKKKKDPIWVVKKPDYEQLWRDLFTDFKECKLVCMVRDPREGGVSRSLKYRHSRKLKRLKKEGNLPIEESEADSSETQLVDDVALRWLRNWSLSVDSVSEAAKAFPNQVMCVKYEDLVEKPEQVMSDVSKFIGIPFNQSLLKPTLRGKIWQGNSSRGKKFENVQKSNLSSNTKIPDYRMAQIELWLGPKKIKSLGYRILGVSKKLPLRSLALRIDETEKVTEYLVNRVRMLNNWVSEKRHSEDERAQ